MAIIRDDLLETLDEEERKEILQQILSMTIEIGTQDLGEKVESLLIARGLITFEDSSDEEETLI